MLTSGDVSPHVIPGISAVLEKFILIYEVDEMLKSLRKRRIMDVIKVKHRLVAREGYQTEQQKTWKGLPVPPALPGIELKKGKKKEKEDEKATVDVNFPKGVTLSAEPTYVTVTTPEQGKQLLGVKVIAFPVSSNKALVELLVKDWSRGFFSSKLKGLSRSTLRKFYALCRGLRIPYIASKTLTGDPKIDILWAGTEFGYQNFVLLNAMEFSEEGFFDSPRKLKKLFRLGWSSFIVADDITKRVTFCMKKFGGMCTTVMYSFMFSTLGSEHARVYNDLEEVRRSAGPFFRTKISKKKFFGEGLASSKLLEYRSIVEDTVKDESKTRK